MQIKNPVLVLVFYSGFYILRVGHDFFKLNICEIFFFVIKIIGLEGCAPAGIVLEPNIKICTLIKGKTKC